MSNTCPAASLYWGVPWGHVFVWPNVTTTTKMCQFCLTPQPMEWKNADDRPPTV